MYRSLVWFFFLSHVSKLTALLCSFQIFFHHVFLRGIEDLGHHVNARGFYSLEFEYKGSFSVMPIRFCENDSLTKCQLVRYPSSTDLAVGQLESIAKVLSAFSTGPQVVCLSGCSLATLRTLETSTLLKKGIEYPSRFNSFSLSTFMHRKEGSVFGRIDFHTQLKYLVVFLSGCECEPWIVHTPELSKVVLLCYPRRPDPKSMYNSHFLLGYRLK